MKVQETPKLNTTFVNPQINNNKKVAFKGLETPLIQLLNFLDTNPAGGAIAVDVCFMDTPRTLVDFTRGPAAGIETGRREFSSTANNTLIGAYGLGAGMLFANAIRKNFNIKAHNMFVSDDILDILGNNWNNAGIKNQQTDKRLEAYIDETLKSIEGFNPEKSETGWVKFTDTEKVSQKLIKAVKEGPEKIDKKTLMYIKSVIGTSIGAESKVRIQKEIEGKTVTSVSNLETLIDNIYRLTKAFNSEKVLAEFNKNGFAKNEFIKNMKTLNTKTAIVGLGIAGFIGLCMQPVNAYLTKKKTGTSGFVGVKGREPDHSKKFKILKTVSAATFGILSLRTIGNYKNILNNIKFKSIFPTIPQFKLIYALTIMSRFMSARDKNELREASIKDTLGFLSWLVFGGFVAKATAAGIERLPMFKKAGEKFVNYNKKENGEGLFNWLTKSNLVSREEVLYNAVKKAGKSALKDDGTARSFKEMFKFVKSFDKAAITKFRWLAVPQIAGYLFSGLALGIGIPKLNIAITKSVEKNREAKEAKESKKIDKSIK